MNTFLASLATLALQGAPLDDLYQFKAGTTWSYERLEDGVERRISAWSLGLEAGKVQIDWKEYRKDGELHKSSVLTWFVEEGALTCIAKSKSDDGQDEELAFTMLKNGAKQHDMWKSTLGEMTHKGNANVSVPAGAYKKADRTRLSLEEDGCIDFFLVPRVGLAKISPVEHGKETQSWELTDFNLAK